MVEIHDGVCWLLGFGGDAMRSDPDSSALAYGCPFLSRGLGLGHGGGWISLASRLGGDGAIITTFCVFDANRLRRRPSQLSRRRNDSCRIDWRVGVLLDGFCVYGGRQSLDRAMVASVVFVIGAFVVVHHHLQGGRMVMVT